MAMIHVNRGATSLGVFSEEEVRQGLRTGRFAPTDIGWREGMANWQPLSQFAELAGATPVAPPLQTGAASISGPAAPRSGLPWDERQTKGLLNALIETLQMVLSRPVAAFTARSGRAASLCNHWWNFRRGVCTHLQFCSSIIHTIRGQPQCFGASFRRAELDLPLSPDTAVCGDWSVCCLGNSSCLSDDCRRRKAVI